MTPRSRPLSENGKVIAFCLIVPLLWPFLPVILILIACENIRNAWWEWKYRRAERREQR